MSAWPAGISVPALVAALQLWDDVLDGKSLKPTDYPDELFDSVGGYLFDGSAVVSASSYRGLLRQWLRPRQRDATVGEAYEHVLAAHALAVTPASDRARPPQPGRPELTSLVLAAATGCGRPQPCPRPASLSYPYLADADPPPAGAVAARIDRTITDMLAAGWNGPIGTAKSPVGDLRRYVELGLYERGADPRPTEKLTRLAYVLATGAVLHAYVTARTQSSAAGRFSAPFEAYAATIQRQWLNPPELAEWRNHSADTLRREAVAGVTELKFPPLQFGRRQLSRDAVLDLLRSVVLAYGTAPTTAALAASVADPPAANMGLRARRCVAVLVELAVHDVATSRPGAAADTAPSEVGPATIEERLDQLIAMLGQSLDDTQALGEVVARVSGFKISSGKYGDYRSGKKPQVMELFERLRRDAHKGPPDRSLTLRAGLPSDTSEVLDTANELASLAHTYLDETTTVQKNEARLIRKFVADLPLVAEALRPGSGLTIPRSERDDLLKATAKLVSSGLEGSTALELVSPLNALAWDAAGSLDRHTLAASVNPVLAALGRTTSRSRASAEWTTYRDLAGSVGRLQRAPAVADSKALDFGGAARQATAAVARSRSMLNTLVTAEAESPGTVLTANSLLAALTSWQLSLLQAGGVYVRGAETLLVLSIKGISREEKAQRRNDLEHQAAAAFAYTNFAIAQLGHIEEAVALGVVHSRELDMPASSYASTAAMGMRTLLLLATVRAASSPARSKGRWVKDLAAAVPGHFREMLELRHLSAANFADLTRIALHHCFMTGDTSHPAGSSAWSFMNASTPNHLRPALTLNLEACGEYLVEQRADAGVLDVITSHEVRRELNVRSNGRYERWRESYLNPVRRSARPFDATAVSGLIGPQFGDPMVNATW